MCGPEVLCFFLKPNVLAMRFSMEWACKPCGDEEIGGVSLAYSLWSMLMGDKSF